MEEVANMAVSTQSRVQRVPGTVAVCRTEESAERASFWLRYKREEVSWS